MSDDLPFWVAFSHVRGIGPVRFRKLLSAFGSAAASWEAPFEALREVVGEGLARCVVAARQTLSPHELYTATLREGIAVIPWDSPAYPALLRSLSNPPFLLYVEGEFSFCAHEKYIAIVGTRRPTPYGVKAARFFARELAKAGWIVVSGLAVGIDGEAQKAVVEEGCPTIAVLGSGLRRIYPAVHLPLAREIVRRGGALVSEYPPGFGPRPEHFPLRNRIISGLSCGVLVVEAPRKSGALITVDFALEMGREVFAVPGPIFSPQSEGTNALIAQGARPVQQVEDILEAFGFLVPVSERPAGVENFLSEKEALLFSYIDHVGVFKEELLGRTGWGEGEFFQVLLALEMKGLVQEIPGGKVVRT